MIGLLTRLVGGALTPLTAQLSDIGARLLRKLALFFVAGVCLVVVLIALTIAFDLWVASRFGAIAGALAVAGLYLAAAAVAVWLALRKPRPSGVPRAEASRAQADLGEQIDDFTTPLLVWLQRLGLRREQLAVLAGASMAKQMGPLPLVGLAILAGFLIGRMATSWRSLVPAGLVEDLLASGLFGVAAAAPESEDEAA